MAKRKPTKRAKASSPKKKSATTKSTGRVRGAKPKNAKAKKPARSSASMKERLKRAMKLEALDAGKSKAKIIARAAAPFQLRNSDFPNTHIQQISVSLDDPDHLLTLTWTGPQAGAQETGPFRTSPGAGLRGLNCDNVTTSRTTGSKCTPKGTFAVEGFAPHLNSDSSAINVTWFVQSRGIALHYYPTVPRFAASHGCVRVESEHVSKLIHDNSVVGDTQVVVSGTWTKPAKQWP